MMDTIQNSTMEDWMWRRIIEKMYDPKDFEVLADRFNEIVQQKKDHRRGQAHSMTRSQLEGTLGLTGNKKVSREEMLALVSNKEGEKLTYHDFQKTILDFQLMEHEKFLYKFTQKFKLVDIDSNGIIDEAEFRELVELMAVIEREEEVDYLLQMVDPYNNQKMTFSEVVHLFSSHMVPLTDDDPHTTIPLLEKFVNENVDAGFQEVENEIARRSEAEFDQRQDNELEYY